MYADQRPFAYVSTQVHPTTSNGLRTDLLLGVRRLERCLLLGSRHWSGHSRRPFVSLVESGGQVVRVVPLWSHASCQHPPRTHRQRRIAWFCNYVVPSASLVLVRVVVTTFSSVALPLLLRARSLVIRAFTIILATFFGLVPLCTCSTCYRQCVEHRREIVTMLKSSTCRPHRLLLLPLPLSILNLPFQLQLLLFRHHFPRFLRFFHLLFLNVSQLFTMYRHVSSNTQKIKKGMWTTEC